MSKAPLEDSMSLDALLRVSCTCPTEDQARTIRQELLCLVKMRERYDLALGRVATVMKAMESWRDLEFATWTEYCDERLGMDVGHVERLIARARKVERRLRSADVRAGGG